MKTVRQENIRFDDMLSEEFQKKLFNRFMIYLDSDFDEHTLFEDIIREEIFIGRDLENIEKICNNLSEISTLNYDRDNFVHFLKCFSYDVGIPMLIKEGYEPSDNACLKIASLSFYRADALLRGYRHKALEEQIKEFREIGISPSFLKGVAIGHIETLIREFEEEMSK